MHYLSWSSQNEFIAECGKLVCDAIVEEVNPLGPIAPKVALLTSYGFVASLFQTKFAHELVFLLVVC